MEQLRVNLCGLAKTAQQIGVTQRWLREEAEHGRVPSIRAGKRFLFNLEAVESVLAARAAKGDASEDVTCK